MSVAVSQRPAAFCPVNNPVVYKFAVTGGPFTLYRLVVGVYKENDNSLIGEMSKSPDLSGDVMADVSQILKTVLYRDWDDSVTNEDEIGSIGFYIKYQEFYTSSATSPVDDVAQIRVAVIASLQIRSNADLDAYVPSTTLKKFLTKFDTPSLWRGYPFTISFISPVGLSNLTLYYKEYDQGNNLLSGSRVYVNAGDVLKRAIIAPTRDETTKILATLSDGSGIVTTLVPSAWTNGANAFGSKTATKFIKNGAVSGVTYSAYQAAIIGNGETPVSIAALLTWTKALAVSATLDVYLRFLDAPGGSVVGVSHAGTYSNNIANLPFIFSFTPLAGNATVMEVLFVLSGATNGDVAIEIQPDQLVFADASNDVSETKTILVKDPCDNPIYLFWKNTLAGDSFWLFDGSQDYGFSYDDEKAKRLTLFDEDISLNEWEALNDVNTIGDTYKTNIEELTDEVDRTKERSDQQLFVIDTEGIKIGVVNITNELSTQTQQIKHEFMAVIEYPEIFLG